MCKCEVCKVNYHIAKAIVASCFADWTWGLLTWTPAVLISTGLNSGNSCRIICIPSFLMLIVALKSRSWKVLHPLHFQVRSDNFSSLHSWGNCSKYRETVKIIHCLSYLGQISRVGTSILEEKNVLVRWIFCLFSWRCKQRSDSALHWNSRWSSTTNSSTLLKQLWFS